MSLGSWITLQNHLGHLLCNNKTMTRRWGQNGDSRLRFSRLPMERNTKGCGSLVCPTPGRDTDVMKSQAGPSLVGSWWVRRGSPSCQAQPLRRVCPEPVEKMAAVPREAAGQGRPATGGYFTMMDCLAAAVGLPVVASSGGLAPALMENSLSTDCRWKLFMAQKGMSRALCSLSGTP